MRAFALSICDIPLPSDAACAGAHSPEATVANCSTYAIFCPKMHFFLKKFAYVQFLLYLCTRFLKRMHILVPCPSG